MNCSPPNSLIDAVQDRGEGFIQGHIFGWVAEEY